MTEQKKKKKERAGPGIEPGTSRTLSENHASRPTSLSCLHIDNSGFCVCLFIMNWLLANQARQNTESAFYEHRLNYH